MSNAPRPSLAAASRATTDVAPATQLLQDARFKLFIRVHSGQNLQSATQGTYCKLYVGDSIMVSGSQSALLQLNLVGDTNTANAANNPNGPQAATHRAFRTHVEFPQQPAHPVWNEKFEVGVFDPRKEVVSIRVKSQQMLYCPTIGACAIYLKQLKLGETVDQWFPLHKGQHAAGHVRLQLLLSVNQEVITKQQRAQDELVRRRAAAEKEAERVRLQRKAEKELEKAKEKERQRLAAEAQAKAEAEAEAEKERRRRRKAEKREQEQHELRVAEERRREKELAREQRRRASLAVAATAGENDRSSLSVMRDDNQVEHALSAAADGVVDAMNMISRDSDSNKTIEYKSEASDASNVTSPRCESIRSSTSMTYLKPRSMSRVSTMNSSQASFAAASQSIENEIQRVAQNALPSDSSDSDKSDSDESSSMSSEEERQLLRKLKEKQRRRKEKAKREAAALLKLKAKRKAKSKALGVSDSDSSDDSDSDDSELVSLSSSESTSSSAAARRKRRANKSRRASSSTKSIESRKSDKSSKHKDKNNKDKLSKSKKNKDKSAKTNNNNNNAETAYNLADAAYNLADLQLAADIQARANAIGTAGVDSSLGLIQTATPQEIKQDGGFDMGSMGDWLQAASSVSDLVLNSSEDLVEQIPTVVGAVTGVLPLLALGGAMSANNSSNNIKKQQKQMEKQQQKQMKQFLQLTNGNNDNSSDSSDSDADPQQQFMDAIQKEQQKNMKQIMGLMGGGSNASNKKSKSKKKDKKSKTKKKDKKSKKKRSKKNKGKGNNNSSDDDSSEDSSDDDSSDDTSDDAAPFQKSYIQTAQPMMGQQQNTVGSILQLAGSALDIANAVSAIGDQISGGDGGGGDSEYFF